MRRQRRSSGFAVARHTFTTPFGKTSFGNQFRQQ